MKPFLSLFVTLFPSSFLSFAGDFPATAMARQRSPELVEEIEEAFRMFDRNGDGCIEKNELKTVIQQLLNRSLSDAELTEMMEEADFDKNGTIELDEFVEFMARKMDEPETEEELREAFKMFDKNDDGFISVDELMEVLTSLRKTITLEEVQQMIGEADLNGDGLIDFPEFAKMMKTI